MNREDIIELIKENLQVRVEVSESISDKVQVEVKILWNGEYIDADWDS